MKYYKITFIVALVILIYGRNGATLDAGPLILSGVDTLLIEKKIGFDFIEQVVCTTFSDYPGCHNHFWFQYYQPPLRYNIVAPLGYGVNMGTINLDSIKTAPPDSIFLKSEQTVDAIPPDSLVFRIGYSYIIKTGPDPRDNTIYYSKIRILNFKVLDSANRSVEMRFLWACNVTGPRRELETSNLDTFDLNTPVLPRTPSIFRKTTRKTVFKVVGDRFLVPQELVGTGAYLTVYDLAGKRLGRVEVGDRNSVDLRGVRKSPGAVVVRVGR